MMPAGQTPLFKADSELEQLSCIIGVRGTYDPAAWGGAEKLPDFEKVRFAPSAGQPLAALLPQASRSAVALLQRCLACGPAPALQCLACALLRNSLLVCTGPLRCRVRNWLVTPRCNLTRCAAVVLFSTRILAQAVLSACNREQAAEQRAWRCAGTTPQRGRRRQRRCSMRTSQMGPRQ